MEGPKGGAGLATGLAWLERARSKEFPRRKHGHARPDRSFRATAACRYKLALVLVSQAHAGSATLLATKSPQDGLSRKQRIMRRLGLSQA